MHYFCKFDLDFALCYNILQLYAEGGYLMDVKETCFFTGHRIIRKEHKNTIIENLKVAIYDLSQKGISHFISGGALGFDTLAANAVIAARNNNPNIKLIFALPCKNQTKGWKQKDIEEYERILTLADEIVYVSEEYYDGCMQKRNRYMADNSSHCVFYMTSPRGGTAYTVKYAIENDIELHNIMIKNSTAD